tara:strand:- start:19570 stop:20700 length:1131 start_codon:yes stop_codon:yes gene_type:complete
LKDKTKQDSKFIPVFKPSLSFKDKLSVLSAMNKKDISGTSPIINNFENKLAEKFNSKKAVAVSNGSVAIDLAFQLLNLTEEDEVILPSFTIISCLSAVIRSKAKPIFCDVDRNSWNMTLKNVKDVFTDNTKAVLMVHTYGLTAEAPLIRNFCDDNNLYLIEDAAEAHGQEVDGKLCGSFGDIATLSFYANKHMTTGEGGALLINDTDYYEKALSMRNLDFNPSRRFQHQNFYWNYRLGGLQAALGISQIENITKTINKKMKQGEIYNKVLNNNENLEIPLTENLGSKNHYWVYGIVIKNKSRDDLASYLLDKGIQTRKFFWPLHLQDALPEKFKNVKELVVSEMLGNNGLYIPLGEHIKEKDQIHIGEEINSFFNK